MSEQQNDRCGSIKAIPEATSLALETVLESGERVTQAVAVVGCSLVLTDRHLMVVREGFGHRPRSGVQRWPLDRTVTLRTTAVRHGTGRIVIEHGGQMTSVFVSSREWVAAETLVMETHRLIHGADAPGSGPGPLPD